MKGRDIFKAIISKASIKYDFLMENNFSDIFFVCVKNEKTGFWS